MHNVEILDVSPLKEREMEIKYIYLVEVSIMVHDGKMQIKHEIVIFSFKFSRI